MRPDPTPLRALWSTAELGVFLSVAPSTLRTWRQAGYGPAWFKLGRCVRYDPDEVRRWLNDECADGPGPAIEVPDRPVAPGVTSQLRLVWPPR
jgi:hypothetical protein